MARIRFLAAILTLALPAASQASVIPTVAADTLTISGDGAADTITVRVTSPTTLDVNGTTFDRSTFSKIAIRSGAGSDTIRIVDALTETVTIESSSGTDTVVGGPGHETIAAGDDADFVHPGGNVNVDLDGVEQLDILPGPGSDNVRVRDMSGTATDHVDVNLAVARGSIARDQTIDRVFVDGTFGNDVINANGAGPDVRVTGLAAITTTRFSDPTLDVLHVDTKPGIDSFTITGTANQLIGITSS